MKNKFILLGTLIVAIIGANLMSCQKDELDLKTDKPCDSSSHSTINNLAKSDFPDFDLDDPLFNEAGLLIAIELGLSLEDAEYQVLNRFNNGESDEYDIIYHVVENANTTEIQGFEKNGDYMFTIDIDWENEQYIITPGPDISPALIDDWYYCMHTTMGWEGTWQEMVTSSPLQFYIDNGICLASALENVS